MRDNTTAAISGSNFMPIDLASFEKRLPAASTSINDLRNIVRFLKQRRNGISPHEITDIFRRRLFEPAKLAAYRSWGIIHDNSDSIRLSELGWRIANGLHAEATEYRCILRSIDPYWHGLKMISDTGVQLVPYFDVADYWRKLFPEALPSIDDRTTEDCVTSFFHLCHSAELGTTAVGRKGQPTRLIVDKSELSEFVNGDEDANDVPQPITGRSANPDNISVDDSQSPNYPGQFRLLVSAEPDSDIPDSLKDILDISDVTYDMVQRSEETIFISKQNRERMRGCEAAIVVAGPKSLERCSDKKHRLQNRLLSEIAACQALFGERVLLLWTDKAALPVELNSLDVIDLPDGTSWVEGLKLGRRIKELRSTSPRIAVHVLDTYKSIN